MEQIQQSSIKHHVSRITFHVFRFIPFFLTGLAATRLLFEGFFPHLLWLGRPFPALSLAFLFALLATWFTRSLAYSLTFSPLLLNLFFFDPLVDLVSSRLIFAASVWLTAVITSGEVAKQRSKKKQIIHVIWLLAALSPIYFLTMPTAVGRADTFEFQVVAPQLGIAHPTGYPLYLLLGKLFTLIPVGSVAWRLNVGTAVFALIALILIYQLGRRLLGKPLPALLGAIALGLTPTFWSQAIEAEVYSLHALIVAAALLLMQVADNQRLHGKSPVASSEHSFTIHNSQFIIHYFIFFLIGLGLTNHLTTVFLLPAAAFSLVFTLKAQLSFLRRQESTQIDSRLRGNDKSQFLPTKTILQQLFKMGLAFLIPLTLYAYLPIRWAAVNGEPMGFSRFIDWIVGGRFQDALQWSAWLNDPTRYEVVGRLFLENWGWINLIIAFIGFIYLFIEKRRMALILLVTWLGFTFYNLNYYVPDLAVFLIPSQIVVAVWWMGGINLIIRRATDTNDSMPYDSNHAVTLTIIVAIIIAGAAENWPKIDRSNNDGLIEWGAGVLSLPLAENAAILADSEKIAPLYYLQQSEGVRPDLDIMVLPDEAAYRAELDGRIAAGQTVYLARFLPGLEGIYHLRSMGPLTEVSAQPMTELPETAVPLTLGFDSVQLIGYELEPVAAIDGESTAVTFYWQMSYEQLAVSNEQIYVRWENGDMVDSQLPANNYYPIPAWEPGEIVPDFHLLPQPISDQTMRLGIQVALAPSFAAPDALDWQTVTTLTLPPTEPMELERPYRIQIGSALLDGAQFPTQIRDKQLLPITVSGYGPSSHLDFSIAASPPDNDEDALLKIVPLQINAPVTFVAELEAQGHHGDLLIVRQPGTAAICGWMAPITDGCLLGEIDIIPTPLPDNAVIYDDKIALLDIDLPETQLQPGGLLPVTLQWISLAPIAEDYTVFIQILDANDRIVGQVDAWPLQGTLPTSQWEPDDIISDPYLVQLDGDLPPGNYRLLVGWYLLADLRRLPTLDDNGAPMDDKFLVDGLIVP